MAEATEGWLDKWVNYSEGYKPRYFVLGEDGRLQHHLVENYGGGVPCESIRIEKAIVPFFGKLNFRVSIETPPTEYALRAKSLEDRRRWLEALEAQGAVLVRCGEFLSKGISHQGGMIPQLSFPTMESESVLLEYQREDHKVHNAILSSLAMVGKSALHTTPGGFALELLKNSLPHLFDLFKVKTDVKKALHQLDQRIDDKMLATALSDTRDELKIVELRFRQMIDESVTPERRRPEVSVVVTFCEKLLGRFRSKEHVFWKYPLILSPYLVQFSYMLMATASVAVELSPHYREELTQQLALLAQCLTEYRDRAVDLRVEAVQLDLPYFREYNWIRSYTITDQLYPKSGQGNPSRSDRTYSNFAENYKIMLREVYEAYFDRAREDVDRFVEIFRSRPSPLAIEASSHPKA